jgi:myo-inositol catabolism protein IolS
LKDLKTYFKSCPLGFGGASLSGEGGGYGFGAISEADSIKLVHEALDLGVQVFDTAPIYGFGLSETRLGLALKGKRDRAFLISKSGVSWQSTKRVDMTNDPKVTQQMLEDSLRRLNTDVIDLYMIHWPDERVDIRRPMDVLARAKEQGKIRMIGLCNTHLDDLAKAQEIAPISAVQSQLNIFEREIINDLLPELEKQNIAFMSWGTLDKGILTGRVNRDRKFEPEDCRSWAPWWKAIDFEARYKILDYLKAWMSEHELTGLQLALGFNLSTPGCDLVLAGARNSKQLQGLCNALVPLERPQRQALLELLEECS